MATGTHDVISDFLAKRRVAVVGASRKAKSYSRIVFHELRRRGYDVVPVNPSTTEMDGVQCFSRVQYVVPPVEAALLVLPVESIERVIADCAVAGIKYVWVRGTPGRPTMSLAALQTCKEKDIRLVEGHCPLMFLPDAGFIHRVHGFFLKLGGKFPR
jgi:predicted CoA-binding protein